MPDDSETVMAPSEESWAPSCSLLTLHVRAAMLQAVRQFFQMHGYLEVETPLLSADIVVDAHLDPFSVHTDQGCRFLQTSPEAGMKRLLASGSGSIFQITRSFRSGECGRHHNPEFTMIEWYGVNTDHNHQMNLTEQLVRHCMDAAALVTRAPRPSWLSKAPFRRITYDNAFRKVLGSPVTEMKAGELLRAAMNLPVLNQAGSGCFLNEHSSPEEIDVDNLLNLILGLAVEPGLGWPHPEFLTNYPISQAALARTSAESSATADRFELYIQGIEICNGYYELTDAKELRHRDQLQNGKRRQHHNTSLPGAPQMLAAMEAGLPECSGVALGFDRLVMLALGSDRLSDAIAFPFDRA